MLHVADTGEVGESLGEGVMGERMGASLREGRVTAGRAEALLEDRAFFGAEGELTVGERTPLEVEDSEVSLGAGAFWEAETAGASFGEIGATEEIVGVTLGDGLVEISLEVSVTGAFLGDGTGEASLGATVTGALGALSGHEGAGAFLV